MGTPLALHPGVFPARAVAQAMDQAASVVDFGTDIDATLAWSRSVAPSVARATRDVQWELLAATAQADVTAARILEPHLDALTILAEADMDVERFARIGVTPDSTWGVFAAEGPGVRVDASEADGRWTLTGTKPWCSLASRLSHALVTAHVADGRRLFAIDLRDPGVRCHDGPWHARGLSSVVSAPIDLDAVPAVAVGDTGWYLARRGFAAGGIGVAAAWWGGAMGVLAGLVEAARRDGADQLSRMHAGRADAALWGARAALAEAAALASDATSLLAARVRTVVAQAADLTLHEADQALGPLPLVADEGYARRVADLHLYLRQHHGQRDAAKIGRDVAENPA